MKIVKLINRLIVRICSNCGHDKFPDGPGPCKNCGHGSYSDS